MFKVYQNQIPASLIDDVLRDHEVFKRSPFSYFRAQGTTRFERPILNKYGNQINSIHNTHLLGFNRSFSRNIEKIITHTNTIHQKKSLKKILRGSLQKNTKTAGKRHVYLC